ncbi:MAG: helicase C-terminal domain-containing protein [bacterium]
MPAKATLPSTIVGIDVETTSLKPATGDIIEIAAIRYDLSKPTSSLLGIQSAEFIRLARPSQPVSTEITAITGITRDMVAESPPFSQFIEKLKDFIGDSLVFAHNASFDVNFLDYHGLSLKKNPVWDTFALASVAWPTSPSYNLGTLTEQLDLKSYGEHRAGDDVRMTWQLLNKIYQQLQITKEAHQEVAKLLKKSGQSHYLGLFTTVSMVFPAAAEESETTKTDTPLDKGEIIGGISEIFSSRGPLAKSLPAYVPRPEQLSMARQVAKLIKNKEIGFIEAAPGTGKTYAYLVPLLLHIAQEKGATISTYTKNLQDQLLHDVPQLLKSLNLPYQVTVLKGRRNYLCLARLIKALQKEELRPDDAWLLIKLLAWLDKGADGDLEYLNVSYQSQHLLRHLHADSISCRLTCSKENSGCPYQQARCRASQADLVIVNHALLVQPKGENGLPLSHVVIDEAHHLESVARQTSQIDFSQHRVEEILASINQLTKSCSPQLRKRLATESKQLLELYQKFLQSATDFLDRHTTADQIRLTEAIRRNSSWQKVVHTGSTWRSQLQFLVGLLESGREDIQNRELLASSIKEAKQFNTEFEMFLNGSVERIQWIQRGMPEDATSTLCDQALSVKSQLNHIFTNASSVTLTSATLTIAGKYDYIKEQLGLPSACELKLESSFSYQDQMLIYIVDDGINPTASSFDFFAARQIEDIAILLSGRVLGLFTSHQSVHSVYTKIISALNKANIKLLAQKITGGRHNITNRFKSVPSSVLLGTYSFWEGIDAPGDTLSCVVISKLPFPIPNNPVHEAMAEVLSVNAFVSFSLPQMILKLRQGIGRLLRSPGDSGAIVILDSRFLSQEYGDQVLQSLPPATIHIGSQTDLIPTLEKWYSKKTLDKWRKDLESKEHK